MDNSEELFDHESIIGSIVIDQFEYDLKRSTTVYTVNGSDSVYINQELFAEACIELEGSLDIEDGDMLSFRLMSSEMLVSTDCIKGIYEYLIGKTVGKIDGSVIKFISNKDTSMEIFNCKYKDALEDALNSCDDYDDVFDYIVDNRGQEFASEMFNTICIIMYSYIINI